jgi:hypothetical protein
VAFISSSSFLELFGGDAVEVLADAVVSVEELEALLAADDELFVDAVEERGFVSKLLV